MDAGHLRAWAHRYRWALVFLAVVVGAYTLGKDAAMRDNRADSAQSAEAEG